MASLYSSPYSPHPNGRSGNYNPQDSSRYMSKPNERSNGRRNRSRQTFSSYSDNGGHGGRDCKDKCGKCGNKCGGKCEQKCCDNDWCGRKQHVQQYNEQKCKPCKPHIPSNCDVEKCEVKGPCDDVQDLFCDVRFYEPERDGQIKRLPVRICRPGSYFLDDSLCFNDDDKDKDKDSDRDRDSDRDHDKDRFSDRDGKPCHDKDRCPDKDRCRKPECKKDRRSPVAIYIYADDVTLNLNGHTINLGGDKCRAKTGIFVKCTCNTVIMNGFVSHTGCPPCPQDDLECPPSCGVGIWGQNVECIKVTNVSFCDNYLGLFLEGFQGACIEDNDFCDFGCLYRDKCEKVDEPRGGAILATDYCNCASTGLKVLNNCFESSLQAQYVVGVKASNCVDIKDNDMCQAILPCKDLNLCCTPDFDCLTSENVFCYAEDGFDGFCYPCEDCKIVCSYLKGHYAAIVLQCVGGGCITGNNITGGCGGAICVGKRTMSMVIGSNCIKLVRDFGIWMHNTFMNCSTGDHISNILPSLLLTKENAYKFGSAGIKLEGVAQITIDSPCIAGVCANHDESPNNSDIHRVGGITVNETSRNVTIKDGTITGVLNGIVNYGPSTVTKDNIINGAKHYGVFSTTRMGQELNTVIDARYPYSQNIQTVINGVAPNSSGLSAVANVAYARPTSQAA